MKKNNNIKMAAIFSAAFLTGAFVIGCGATGNSSLQSALNSAAAEGIQSLISEASTGSGSTEENSSTTTNGTTATTTSTATTVSSDSDLYSKRDLSQTADTSSAKTITLESGKNVEITEEGVYVIKGNVTESTIIVSAPEEAKVQLVLDGVTVTNTSTPVIYVKAADKVFVTTTSSENTLTVTGSFTSDGDTNTDAVIFSKSDLTLNGTGTLTIVSKAKNAVTSKDDLIVTGGTYVITAAKKAFEANDNLAFAGGTFTINAAEGMEGTNVVVDGGTFDINASDDGINATQSTKDIPAAITINGGTLNINMGSGDTDALDSNGDLIINGGTVNITAQFAFDFDGKSELNGGTVTVNGSEVTSITNSMMMGGGGHGGMGFPGGDMNGDQMVPGGQMPPDQNMRGGRH
ncbi:MAG: carbohydrate-binding domain-containing protein [Lachnospiraceae bacterium]|nr:carbohydrate-binding domain-containing protein [Lachnospiraceae bacterium]